MDNVKVVFLLKLAVIINESWYNLRYIFDYRTWIADFDLLDEKNNKYFPTL